MVAVAVNLEVDVCASARSLKLRAAFSIPAGIVCALSGSNGAGKTTLLRVIAGLHPLKKGRIALGETVFEDAAMASYMPTDRRGIGFVFQDAGLIKTMTAVGNVAFGLRAKGMPRRDAESESRRKLAALGLADQADVPAPLLSRGQAQQVALVRALVTDPQVLLLDEPFAALDDAAKAASSAFLSDFLGSFSGPTILVTHDGSDAERFAEMSLLMHEGEVPAGSVGGSAG